MPNLVTIWSFSYQHQLLTIRAQMEAEGIETFTGDELTIQIDPLYSNALGGIKLMVHQQDVTRATEILAEAGYVKREEPTEKQFLPRLLRYIDELPLLSNLNSEHRVFAFTAVAVILVAFLLYLLTLCF
jgi:hypothetical protein